MFDEFERSGEETVVANLRHYTSIRLQVLRKTTIIPVRVVSVLAKTGIWYLWKTSQSCRFSQLSEHGSEASYSIIGEKFLVDFREGPCSMELF